MAKNILFLSHSYNDVDWFLPLIDGLQESNNIKPMMLFLRTKEESQISKAHNWVIEALGIERVYIQDLFRPRVIHKTLHSISTYCSKKTKLTPLSDLLRDSKLIEVFLKIIYITVSKFYKKFHKYIFPAKEMELLIKKNDISAVVLDEQRVSREEPYIDFRTYATAKITSFCRENGIKIIMLPHGGTTIISLGDKEKCSYVYRDQSGRIPEVDYNESTHYYPDLLILSVKYDKLTKAALAGKATKIMTLGALRYDYSWIKKIEKISIDTADMELNKKVFTILYMMTPFDIDDIDKKNHKDIIGLLKVFPHAEMWIKHHPRNPWLFEVDEDLIPRDVAGRIKRFRNEVDTNVLMNYSDLIVSPGSSMITQAIILGKPAIVYDWWKDRINFTGKTQYENVNCVMQAKNSQQLKECCSRAISGEKPNIGDIDEFYRTRISEGLSKDESTVSRYIEALEKIL